MASQLPGSRAMTHPRRAIGALLAVRARRGPSYIERPPSRAPFATVTGRGSGLRDGDPMTGRDALSEGRARGAALAPGAAPAGPRPRPRGFAITDLLGLEAELPSPAGPGPASGCEGPAAAPRPGPGLGSPRLALGPLPLGLGLLCGFGAQPPAAARAPRLLLADVPVLPRPDPEPATPPARRPPSPGGRQKRSESVSTSGNWAIPSHP